MQVLDSHAWLAGLPLSRPHAERMQHDVDIANGYMHSGYPVSHQLVHLRGCSCTALPGWGSPLLSVPEGKLGPPTRPLTLRRADNDLHGRG